MFKRVVIVLNLLLLLGGMVLYHAKAKTTTFSASISQTDATTQSSTGNDPMSLTVVYRQPQRLVGNTTIPVPASEVAATFDNIIYHGGFHEALETYVDDYQWDGLGLLYIVLSGIEGPAELRKVGNLNRTCFLNEENYNPRKNHIMWDPEDNNEVYDFCDLQNAIAVNNNKVIQNGNNYHYCDTDPQERGCLGFDHDNDSNSALVYPIDIPNAPPDKNWFLHVPTQSNASASHRAVIESGPNTHQTMQIQIDQGDRLVGSVSQGSEENPVGYFFRPNPGNPLVRQMFAGRIKALLASSATDKFNGLFLDNVEFLADKLYDESGGGQLLPTEYANLDEFETDILQMVSLIRTRVDSAAQTTALDGPQANVPCPDDNCGPIYPTPPNCESMQNMQVPDPDPCEPLPFGTPTPTDGGPPDSSAGEIPIWGNMIQDYDTSNGWDLYSGILSGGMQESFALDWEGCPRASDHIMNQIGQAQAWIGAGNHYLAVTQGSRSETCGGSSYDDRARFALGVYLLIAKSGQSSFHLADTRGEDYPNDQYDYGRYDIYNELPEYNIEFGQGGDLNQSGNIYTRSFASGCTVRVDLTTKTADICPERFTEFLYLPLIARTSASTAASENNGYKNDEKTTRQLKEVCSWLLVEHEWDGELGFYYEGEYYEGIAALDEWNGELGFYYESEHYEGIAALDEWHREDEYSEGKATLQQMLSQLCKEPESAHRLQELCYSLQKIEIKDEWEEKMVEMLKEICAAPNSLPQSTPPSGYPPPATATPHSYP